jgi:multicomponent Na+:H+ antiporter subunit D
MSPTPLVILAVVTPAVAASLIWVFRDWANTRDAISLIFGVALLSMVLALYPQVADGLRLSSNFGEMLPGLEIAFVVEPLGMLFALVSSSLWIVTTVYSIGYMRYQKDAHQGRFFMFFALSISAAIGIAFAGNLFTLFIAYEALTLATYPLVAHYGTDAARRGARVYLGLLLSTSIGFLLVAIIATWSLAGTLEFIPGGILAGKVEPWAASLLLVLYVFGIGKAAVMPFHRWLPSAMVAPAPVSALLHAVAVVKAGVFTILKVMVYVFGIDFLAGIGAREWLMYIAGATVLIASLVALREDNLKARLAYSTISQLSYIVLAALLASSLGIIGGAMHIATHAFGKITLFFCAGAIYASTGEIDISRMRGVGRRMPWTMGAFAVAAISMIGLPPTAGFVSKWYVLLGALDADQMVAVVIIVVSTLLNAAYFLPIVYAAFFGDEMEYKRGECGEAPTAMVFAMTTSAAIAVLLFLFPGALLGLAGQLVGDLP